MKSIVVASVFFISGILSGIALAAAESGYAFMFITCALGGICGVVAGCLVLTDRP